ncbi:MAG TPA: Bax inhibitor-1/YccA family protein [Kiloniellales bacterium]|nr:Bax inhibitor-1/YccA family protein [Kiloniellales bacterium]
MLQPNTQRAYTGARVDTRIDEGLRSYMLRVYNYMALGVAFTGGVAFLLASNVEAIMAVQNMFWLFFIGILGLGWFAPRLIFTGSMVTAQVCYWVYAGLWGAALAPLFFVYGQLDPMLIVRAFLITAGAFAGVSIWGYTTKRNLSAFATFFVMASIGLVIAIVVNAIFVQDMTFSLLISCVVVLLFSGITAWETQMIKNMYLADDNPETAQRKAIFGAFALYGSFITLFVHILNILGMARE